jgi:uncharacterized protein (UPF0332 family)
MDSTIDLCLKRSDNELVLATIIQRISEETQLKKDVFHIAEEFTFYSAVIGHSYYAIFHSAKAYLISKGLTFPDKQGQHQKVYYEFRKLVNKGVIDRELLKMYELVKGRANALLEILEKEREKRTTFMYEKLPQANREPAEESLSKARHFVSHMRSFIEK